MSALYETRLSDALKRIAELERELELRPINPFDLSRTGGKIEIGANARMPESVQNRYIGRLVGDAFELLAESDDVVPRLVGGSRRVSVKLQRVSENVPTRIRPVEWLCVDARRDVRP